uniref:Uncharacterized protein n=1 Tax=Anguilla anguilla TaxID=7936 RepID=A0A0E9U790_ANGAN
MIEVKITS